MYENLKDTLCEELEKYDRRGEMSAGELEAVHKLTDTIKNLYKMDMFEGGDSYADYDDDMSSRRYVRGYYRSRESRDSYGDSRDSYGGGSYNRGSYGRGRRGGYSYAETVDQLKELMQGADEKEKMAIKKAIQQIEK
jgi:hypothetical protein